MGKRVLYVGGLTDTMTEWQLRTLFSAYGCVSRTHVVRHKHNQKSAGFAFVEMGSAESALNAVLALDGTEYGGQRLRLYVTPYAASTS